MGLLARWFRFQPSEIDALTIEDFVMWIEQAARQVRRENGG
ncbi:MAG: GpE family phage tail protein [Alphaproteobacteria bacterium]|jgi:hypothetical protein|nr:GpE family phage tail protein [Alphaproteobacteria bacterium]